MTIPNRVSGPSALIPACRMASGEFALWHKSMNANRTMKLSGLDTVNFCSDWHQPFPDFNPEIEWRVTSATLPATLTIPYRSSSTFFMGDWTALYNRVSWFPGHVAWGEVKVDVRISGGTPNSNTLAGGIDLWLTGPPVSSGRRGLVGYSMNVLAYNGAVEVAVFTATHTPWGLGHVPIPNEIDAHPAYDEAPSGYGGSVILEWDN